MQMTLQMMIQRLRFINALRDALRFLNHKMYRQTYEKFEKNLIVDQDARKPNKIFMAHKIISRSFEILYLVLEKLKKDLENS